MGKVLAAYGGGFKPPTAGHFLVVKKALEENPEIDELTVFVGGGERDGIGQAESILIWEIFAKYLPMKVKIKPSKAPIGDVVRLGKNNPDDTIYFVIGGREGRDDDLADIASRTKGIEAKYPNMKIKPIQTPDEGMSGTNARRAARVSLEKFENYLPPLLKPQEKEEIFNIVRPVIKEEITKGQLNSIEAYADSLFNKLGIDIEFTKHFLERVNDERNIKPITTAELIGMFKRLYKKHGKPLSKVDDDFDAVVKDFNNNINIPFAINVTDDDIEMYAKTVMRKKDFKTSTPVIPLQEGRYDQEVLAQSRFIINMFKAEFGNKFEESFDGQIEDIYYDLDVKFIPSSYNLLGPVPFIVNAAGDGDSIEVVIVYVPEAFPEAYNDLNAEIKDTLRHELEHVGQFNLDKGVDMGNIDQDDLDLFDYLTLDYEIPAFVQGLYKKSKTKKITLTQAIQDFLDERAEELSTKEEAKIMKIYTDWAKENLPAAQLQEGLSLEEIIIEVVPKDILDSFDIQDTLVQDVWDGEKLKPEIRKKLLRIAKDFFDSLDLPEGVKLKDIKLTGSLANYNWSKFSDVDLHLVLDYTDVDDDEEFVRNYFMAKKGIWNDAHDITIYGFPVEVYVENEGESHTASGLYSVLNDEWIVIPKKQEVMIDKDDITTKAEGYISQLESIQKLYNDGEYEQVIEKVDKIKERLRNMRSAGLEKGGEYSVENLAFKVLRRSDFIGQLNDLKSKSYDTMMTLNENASYSSDIDYKAYIKELTKYMIKDGWNIQPLPKVVFKHGDSENARDFFGKTAYYDPNTQTIVLYTEGRHPKDIVRSFSHEMVHHEQNLDGRLGDITTTNTQEDDKLNDIEKEANLNGTMTFRNWTDSLQESINEYGYTGPSSPKVYIVKDDGTYKEAPIELLSKISNLTYDMGGGETNYYPAKSIVIVDNIPIETFAKKPGEIKGEKVYVEYNLNNPISLPKADKIIASQIVYHLNNREAFAQTVANSLKDGGTFEFQSDLMNKKDKVFLQHLSDEYGFGLPKNLNKYKQEPLPLKKGEFVEPVISYIYKIIDKDGKAATLSTTKKGNSWEWKKIDGDIDFKTGGWSKPPEDPDPEFKSKERTLGSFNKYLSYFGDSNTIVDFKKLNEAKPYKHKHGFDDKLGKDPFGLNAYARELAQGLEESLNEGVYDSIVSKLAKNVITAWKTQFNDNPKRLFALLDTSYEFEDAKGRPMDFEFLAKLDFKKTKDRQYKVDGGANEGDDETEGFVALNFQVDPRELPQMWSTIAMDIRDVLRHELEHLTQGGWNVRMGKEMEDDQFIRDLIQKYKTLAPKNYFLLDKEVDAMLQGMYYKAKKSRTPFADVIDDYLNKVGLKPEEKEEIKTRWRDRRKALSLPVFEKKDKMEYKIFSDMDGVLTDFDERFKKYSKGIMPSAYEKQMGKDKFWELVDETGGVAFWVGMPWMTDGKKYWDYIKNYDVELLSSPSRSDTSRLGKRLWVRNNMPGIKLNLAQAKDKQNYAAPNHILIDDRTSNIEEWRAAGGIGILHRTAEETIQQLKKLGL